MRAITWTVAGLIALCAGAVAVIFVILWGSTSMESERKIKAALDNHYPGKRVHVQHRANWSYANQICFDLVVVDPALATGSRRVGMVAGDLDGGIWHFSREYRSIEACKRDFHRG